MNAPEHFILTAGEKSHPLWKRLEAHFGERLLSARRQNDNIQTEQETAALRGQIKCLKALINLGKDEPPIIDG